MIADLCAWAERDFPISAEANGGRLMLTLEDMPPEGKVRIGDGGVRLCARMIRWEQVEDGTFQILDVKEQEVWFFDAVHLSDPRLAMMWEGWVRAVQESLEGLLLRPKRVKRWNMVDCLVPYEFFPSDLLKLKRAGTAEGFYQACVGAKKRLKRFCE